MYKKLTFLAILFIGLNSITYAQNIDSILTLSKKEVAQGKISKAYNRIKPLAIKFPNEFDLLWYSAKTAYWNWDIAFAKKFYLQAIELKKDHLYIQLDYAKMLVEIGDYNNALPLLQKYIAFDQWSEEAQRYKLKALYFSSNLKAALKAYENMPSEMQKSQELIALKKEILFQHGYNIKISNNISIDDQPLKTFTPSISISRQQSSLFNWEVKGSYYSFQRSFTPTYAYTWSIGNEFRINKLHNTLSAFWGLSNLPDLKQIDGIGGIKLKQNINSHFSLEINVERKNYFNSLASIQIPVFYNIFSAAIATLDFKKISGKVMYEQQKFNDDNTITNYSGWVLSPSLKLKWLKVKVGYSFQNAHAQKDHYVPTISMDSLLVNYDSTKKIQGVYNPYFTQAHQNIHAALLWLELKPMKQISIICNANYALSASLDNPYFFLNKNLSGQTFIDKGFANQTYQPIDCKADLYYQPKNSWQLGLGYEYLKTNYYEANYFRFYFSLHGI